MLKTARNISHYLSACCLLCLCCCIVTGTLSIHLLHSSTHTVVYVYATHCSLFIDTGRTLRHCIRTKMMMDNNKTAVCSNQSTASFLMKRMHTGRRTRQNLGCIGKSERIPCYIYTFRSLGLSSIITHIQGFENRFLQKEVGKLISRGRAIMPVRSCK